MSHSLLIWEEVPENTKLYLIPNDEIETDERVHLQAAHGYFINLSNQPKDAELALEVINQMLDGDWAKYLVYNVGADEKRPEIVGTITNVYLCGFIC